MRVINRKIVILAAAMLLTVSCATRQTMLREKESDYTHISGKVYDGEGNMCRDAVITLRPSGDDHIVSREVSDVTGSFFFPPLAKGKYIVTVEKEGFRSERIEMEAQLSEQNLYFKIYDGSQLLYLAVSEIEGNRLARAETALDDLGELGAKEGEVAFLRAVILWKKDDEGKALEILEALSLTEDDPYVAMFRELLENNS